MRKQEEIQKDMNRLLDAIDEMKNRLKTRKQMKHEASPSMKFDYVHDIEIAQLTIARLTKRYQKLLAEKREADPNRAKGKTIQEQLTYVIENSPLQLKDIATISGVSVNNLLMIRAGKISTRVVTLEKLCEAIGYEIILRKK